MKEMSAGLSVVSSLVKDDEDDVDENANDVSEVRLSVNPPVRREDKKTKLQRNTEARVRAQVRTISSAAKDCYIWIFPG